MTIISSKLLFNIFGACYDMYVHACVNLVQPMRKLNDSNDYYVKCVWEEWVWNLAVISLNLKIIIIVTY